MSDIQNTEAVSLVSTPAADPESIAAAIELANLRDELSSARAAAEAAQGRADDFRSRWIEARAASAALAEVRREGESLQTRLTAATEKMDHLSREQITDGSDPRLVAFWSSAEETANDEGYCAEYDRLAEALGGPRREREYEVTVEVTATITLYKTVTARDEDDAASDAFDEVEEDDVVDAARLGRIEWEVTETSV